MPTKPQILRSKDKPVEFSQNELGSLPRNQLMKIDNNNNISNFNSTGNNFNSNGINNLNNSNNNVRLSGGT